jgi:rSAM/selenodomain-associated transferase 2
MTPLVTVVIPVLADADAVTRLLAQLPDTPTVEIVVVDGAADPLLGPIVAAHSRARLRHAGVGRGRQMNLGAGDAAGEWLWFLHADTVVPAGWLPAFEGLEAHVTGGWFEFALDDAAWQARLIERLVRWRTRYLRLPYGDQGIFVRRAHFRRLRGFREWPLLEDVDFARRLARSGPVAGLSLPLTTSARRWRRDGWFRRSTLNIAIVALYFAGVSPARLAGWYDRSPRRAA